MRDRIGVRQSTILGGVVVALLALALASTAQAQTFSTGTLAGTWSLFQIVTPKSDVSAVSVHTYRSGCVSCVPLTFDGAGNATGTVADEADNLYAVTGTVSLSAGGLFDATLTLTPSPTGPSVGTLEVQEARILVNQHTIVGTSTLFGGVGLFTLVKLEGAQTFDRDADLAGNWNYNEITPSNGLAHGDAAWVHGDITFHELTGCTDADLFLPDGTPRAQRSQGIAPFG